MATDSSPKEAITIGEVVEFLTRTLPDDLRERWAKDFIQEISQNESLGLFMLAEYLRVLARSNRTAESVSIAAQIVKQPYAVDDGSPRRSNYHDVERYAPLYWSLMDIVQWFAISNERDSARELAWLLPRFTEEWLDPPSYLLAAKAMNGYIFAMIGARDTAREQALKVYDDAMNVNIPFPLLHTLALAVTAVTLAGLEDQQRWLSVKEAIHKIHDNITIAVDHATSNLLLFWMIEESRPLLGESNIEWDAWLSELPAKPEQSFRELTSKNISVEGKIDYLLNLASNLLPFTGRVRYSDELLKLAEELVWTIADPRSSAYTWSRLALAQAINGQGDNARIVVDRALSRLGEMPRKAHTDLIAKTDSQAEDQANNNPIDWGVRANITAALAHAIVTGKAKTDVSLRVKSLMAPVRAKSDDPGRDFATLYDEIRYALLSGQEEGVSPFYSKVVDLLNTNIDGFLPEDVPEIITKLTQLGADAPMDKQLLLAIHRLIDKNFNTLGPELDESMRQLATFADSLGLHKLAKDFTGFADTIINQYTATAQTGSGDPGGDLAIPFEQSLRSTVNQPRRGYPPAKDALTREEPPVQSTEAPLANRLEQVGDPSNVPAKSAQLQPIATRPVTQDILDIDYFECEITLGRELVKMCARGRSLDGSEPHCKFVLNESQLLQALSDRGLQGYGEHLFHALFPPNSDLLFTYVHALEVARAAGQPLHLRLNIDTNVPEYHLLQWEYLYDPYDGHNVKYVAGNPATPFSRRLPFARAAPKPKEIDKLAILFVLANPVDLGQKGAKEKIYRLPHLEMATEIDVIRSAAAAMKSQLTQQGIVLEEYILSSDKQPVTLTTIHDWLSRHQCHILHLIAHGIIDNGVHQVILEDDNHRALPHTAADFARELEETYGVQLVFLASCLSGRQSESDAYRGLAAKLVEQNIPAVIAMMQKVSFATVHQFTQNFYSHLAFHGVVDRAMNAARRQLYAGDDWHRIRNDREWAIPLLFMRSLNGHLFHTGHEPQTLATEVLYEVQPKAFDLNLHFNAEQVVGDLVAELGERLAQRLQLNTVQQRALEQRVLQIAENPPSEIQATQIRPLVFANDPARRRALVTAVNRYRKEPWRCVVLLLREYGRRHVLKQLADKTWLNSENWRQLLGNGTVQLDGQTHSLSSGIPTGSPPNPQDLRRRLRKGEVNLAIQGNLTWQLDDSVRWLKKYADVIDALLTDEASIGTDERLKTILARKELPIEVATGLLHLARPGEMVPFDATWVQKVQAWLGYSGLEKAPTYQTWLKLCKDLLADDELGFNNLADIVLFLQHAVTWQNDPDRPAKATNDNGVARLERRAELALNPAVIDSTLELPEPTFPTLAAALNAGKHVILIGPPGTGKTSLAEDICRGAADFGFCRGFLSVTATADWTTFDTVGGYMPTARGELHFRPGVFLQAISQNRWLIINEINRADIDKAFGELFTVLSGQSVTLPYLRGGQHIRILPPDQVAQSANDYVLPHNWRILGTMNVYDKASLFVMSNAFMRRFAFVDVGLPAPELYKYLINHFFEGYSGFSTSGWPQLIARFNEIFAQDKAQDNWPLMNHRELGPAFAKDMVAYLVQRRPQLKGENDQADYLALAEAFNLYVTSQLDGLDRAAIRAIYGSLHRRFKTDQSVQLIRSRITELFPHIKEKEWQDAIKEALAVDTERRVAAGGD